MLMACATVLKAVPLLVLRSGFFLRALTAGLGWLFRTFLVDNPWRQLHPYRRLLRRRRCGSSGFHGPRGNERR